MSVFGCICVLILFHWLYALRRILSPINRRNNNNNQLVNINFEKPVCVCVCVICEMLRIYWIRVRKTAANLMGGAAEMTIYQSIWFFKMVKTIKKLIFNIGIASHFIQILKIASSILQFHFFFAFLFCLSTNGITMHNQNGKLDLWTKIKCTCATPKQWVYNRPSFIEHSSIGAQKKNTHIRKSSLIRLPVFVKHYSTIYIQRQFMWVCTQCGSHYFLVRVYTLFIITEEKRKNFES